MKVEYIEPFVQAACLVLGQVSGGSATPGSLSLLGNTFPVGSTSIAARVEGVLSGELIYSMNNATARKLAGLVTGREARGFGRVTGAGLSSLGSALAEQTALLLSEQGHDCRIGFPAVLQGMNVEFSAAFPALSVTVDTDAGQVDIHVAVRNGE